MIEFRNEDEPYLAWLEANPDGWILSQSSRLLHHASCGHRGAFVNVPYRMTRATKWCFASRAEAVAWAEAHGRGTETCEDCGS